MPKTAADAVAIGRSIQRVFGQDGTTTCNAGASSSSPATTASAGRVSSSVMDTTATKTYMLSPACPVSGSMAVARQNIAATKAGRPRSGNRPSSRYGGTTT